MNKPGKLFVVSTPIGNLGDMTYRGVEILKNVELVLAEDTRVSAKLLAKYKVEKEMLSYRDQNHDRTFPMILSKLLEGKDVALISDAGTPLISDPGYKLLNGLIASNIEIVSIPGASALTAALSISGLPTDRFAFLGFIPKSKKKRKDLLIESMGIDQTVVLYESPYRVMKLIEAIAEIDQQREIVLCNDITKLYEKVWRGKSSIILSLIPAEGKLKGEFVLLIGKKGFSFNDS